MLSQINSAQTARVYFGNINNVKKKPPLEVIGDKQIDLLEQIAKSLESLAKSNQAMLEIQQKK